MDAVEVFARMDYSEFKVMFCERFDQHSPIWNLEKHSHAYLELLFFLKGEATIAADGQTLSPASYDMVVYLPHHEHQEEVDLGRVQEIVCVWVDVGNLPPVQMGAFRLRDSDRVLEWLCVHLHEEHHKNSVYSRRLERCYLEAIFQTVGRMLAQMDSESAFDAIGKVRAYIKRHFTEAITTEQLAQLCHVSPSYLHRIFRRQIGVSPVQYITGMRIKQAEYLLNSTDFPMGEVARRSGYEDPRYFSRVFRRQTGISPTEYKHQCLQNHHPAALPHHGNDTR